MTVQIPSSLLTTAQSVAPDLWMILVSIGLHESPSGVDGDYTIDGINFYPAATAPAGSHPTSFGYLQLHTPGGLGDGYSPDQLRDGTINLSIGRDYIRGRISGGASLQDALSPWNTRTADWATYQQILVEYVSPTGSNTPAPAVPAGTVKGPMLPGSVPTTSPVNSISPLGKAIIAFGIAAAVLEVI